MDIRLDASGDIEFSNGKLSMTRSKPESVAQALSIELGTHLGEWMFDEYFGVDWFGSFFTKGVNKGGADNFVKYQILRNKNVKMLDSFTSTFSNRSYSCRFSAVTEEGKRYIVNIAAESEGKFKISISE